MKKILTVYLFCVSIFTNLAFGQITSGNFAPNIVATDIDGNLHELDVTLASGKEVIVMFFTTWSQPCWDYLDSQALNDYYQGFGPNGSNEVEVWLIEADLNNDISDIQGQTMSSVGDYTSLVNFPIIDDASGLIDLYELAYFPTVYRICSNGVLSLIDQLTYDQLTNPIENYCNATQASVNPYLSNLYVQVNCQSSHATVILANMGIEPLTSCDIVTSTLEGFSNTVHWTGSLQSNESEIVDLGEFSPSQQDLLTAYVSSQDDIDDEPLTTDLFTSSSATSHIQIDLLTDDYPYEISWTITNSSGEIVVASEPYEMEQTQYLHDLFLSEEDCYNIDFFDSWGDGLFWTADVTGHIHVSSIQADGDIIPIYTYNGNYEFSVENASFVVSEIVPMSVTGHVFLDANENAYSEQSENGIAGIEVHLDDLITYTDESGNFIFSDVDNNINELYIVYDETLYPTNTTATNYSLNGVNQYSYNFGLSANDPNYNLNAYMSEPWFFCGFDGQVWFQIENAGNQVTDGNVTLTLDPLLVYTYSNPQADVVNGNVLTWNLESIGLGELQYFSVGILNPGFEFMGQNITNTLVVTSYDDEGNDVGVDEANNTSPLFCSYDPNDKAGLPTGETEAHFIQNGTDLEYLIRFQNTGNYQAFNIHVKDVMDEDLDLNSMSIVSTSHYCQPTINTTTREVDFFFPDINLADSASNEAESHGYIRYRISPLENLPELTTINNTAYIYFDFNPAIVTNTTLHTVSDLYFGIEDLNRSPLSVFPNPANEMVNIQLPMSVGQFDITISDLQGRVILSKSELTGQYVKINCENIASGTYVISVTPEHGEAFKPAKLIIAD